ncbi:nicotinate (nicotinamide) nucleotide adenylyltransferase [Xenophilus arseniciresistens]|uniref:Probable nicotinate-nucleotide adenylyltransferase n=1 Tax=Xenophilus arseniciresistens TaxID=1283306 RepID=A0AAE3T2A6_9BURK|nr:nicotinate (nicotinamide) nucleotide adenylyltransferase [Xenophilus arseniciresistens]MDA7418192.1 nicotinate (nicotinamide) nucleotide adenylyltransferase [Xenophilus arseniciresistens]
MPRVGMFGGSFDPPHLTHVALARAALAQAGLQSLHVMPTGQAWHKARQPSAAAHRLAMARLAFADVPGVQVDDRETRREGPTYTLDTLRELQREHPGARLVLLIGTDQAAALPSWHGWQQIVSMATVLVATRAGLPSLDPRTLPGLPAGASFETLALSPADTSATDIRARAARGEDISALVPPAVARYIDQHQLYRTA